MKRKHEEESEKEDEGPPDEVRLWEDGFKSRYYESKFDVKSDDIEFRHRYVAMIVKRNMHEPEQVIISTFQQ